MHTNKTDNIFIESEKIIFDIETIISNKVKAIQQNSAFEQSMSLHLIAYIEILDTLNSKNNHLRLELQKLLQKSYLENLQKLKNSIL